MADTFSNDLRLRLQESGSNASTWGTLLNGTITNIASALGQGSEVIPNASTHTITLADGTADEARSLYLKCTGGGQACTVTLGPNTISKVWIIDNTTSFTLTFSQGSGANVAIAAGAVKVIATDGAGSGAAVVDTLDGLEGSFSTLAVTGTVTADSNLLVGGTSTNPTGQNVAGAAIDATGEGNFSVDGAEALRLNRKQDGDILKLMAAGTTVGSTGAYNSATYIQSGSAGSYTGLYFNTNKIEPVGDASGDIRADATVDQGSYSYRFKDGYFSGDVNATNFTGVGDGDTFIGMSGSNIMRFSTGNAERMRIQADGAVVINNTGGDAQIYLGGSSGTNRMYLARSGAETLVWNASNGAMRFATNNAERMRIRSDGTSAFSTDGNYAANKHYSFRDAVGIDNPNSSSYSTSTAAVLCAGKMSSGRSINATGTVNASGADYAEYMYKADGCGTIAKGDVVGVDINGKLTDVFADAISFVIKSTDPSYVGGDTWADEEPPTKDEEDTTEWDSWYKRTETKRATVDRIAFSGQVPVTITGSFNVGDYVYPEVDGSNIKAVAKSSPTFEEYKLCVGKIWATEKDGRPFVAVKIG